MLETSQGAGLLEALEENPFPCLFHILEATCIPLPGAPCSVFTERDSSLRFCHHMAFPLPLPCLLAQGPAMTQSPPGPRGSSFVSRALTLSHL